MKIEIQGKTVILRSQSKQEARTLTDTYFTNYEPIIRKETKKHKKECGYCGKTYKYQGALDKHILSHVNDYMDVPIKINNHD